MVRRYAIGLVALMLGVIAPRLCGEIRVLGVTTTAGFSPGLPGAGSPATIFCTGLNLVSGGPIRVTYTSQGVQAPLYGVVDLGAYQIVNFQVPWEIQAGAPELSQDGNRVTLDGTIAQWGEFFTTADGTAIALHAVDFSLITAQKPPMPNEWIVLYASNLGPVVGPPPTGSPAPLDHAVPLDAGTAYPWNFSANLIDPVQDTRLTTNFFGLAPGFIGVYQVNVQLPASLPPGPLQIYLQRVKDCGFFFVQGCGRGVMLNDSVKATLVKATMP